MKPIHKLLIASLAAVALSLSSQAAPVTWDTVQSITGASNIVSTGLASNSLAGANFGITTGTTTLVNNGSVDIEFKSLRSGQTVTLKNGINVAAASAWGNWGNAAANSAVAGNFGSVLDSNLGIELNAPVALSADITLSNLSIGTQYQIQFFADSTGNNSQTISGSGNMDSKNGQFVTGTFTADATTQVLAVTRATGDTQFAVANALTIGTLPVADTTPPTWTATWPQAAPLSSTSLTVRAKTNEAGKAYFVVLAAGATAPSAAQVKAGTDSGDAPALKSGSLALTANTEATAPVTGLTTDTTYDVYCAAEDTVPNLQAGPSMVSVSLVPSAVVTWGAVQALTGAADIASTGVSGLAGANFGITTGTTTIVNNGAGETGGVDVEFKSLHSGQNATLANGINVAAASAWGNWGPAGGNSAVPGNFGIVLDSNLGIEDPGPAAADITLSGLAIGTTYKIQFFADSTGNNSQTISGSNAMNTLNGQFVTGTFTANATSLVLTVARTTDFGVANALTIGVATGGGNTFANWIGGYDGLNGLTGFNDDADGDGLDNGLENFLGTAPNAGNAGLTAGTLSGNTFTFTHPQNATPASDVSEPVYTWSTDLQTFHASGASVGGITVALTPSPNTPSAGTTTVTATITGTVPPKLFVRLGVTQQ